VRCFFPTGAAKRIAVVLAALALCFLPGCYEHEVRGNESSYHWVWWLGPAVTGAGILGVAIAWFLRKRSPVGAMFLVIMALVLFLIVAPSMYTDRVVVDSDHFEATYGFWFSPSVHKVRFNELSEIRYVEIPGNRGKINQELHCVSNTGDITVVHIGDLVRNTVDEILTRAKTKGVRVVGQPP
jgi:hypothetical protein